MVSSDGKSWMKDNHFEYISAADNVEFISKPLSNTIVLSCRKTTAKFWSNNFKYWYTWGLYADG